MNTNPYLQKAHELRAQKVHPARVLSRTEVQTMFPRTMHEQVFLADILRWVQQARYESMTGRVGETAVGAAMLAERRERLEGTKLAFCRMVSLGLMDLGVTEDHVEGPACRVKDFAEAERKYVVRQYRHETRGMALHAVPDLVAGELIVRDEVSPDQLIWALHRHLDLPDEYPDGQKALQVGRTSHISAPEFQARKLTIPFLHDEALHLGELRIWTPVEKEVDAVTRLPYVFNRAREYEEALGYFLSQEV